MALCEVQSFQIAITLNQAQNEKKWVILSVFFDTLKLQEKIEFYEDV